ncbi:MAG: protein-disulfide reductase DsbD domain-containing protein [Methyloceanibacter sp.]|uniref:protein-disulfide reductase DsbD domain-containing protein n=1 Tax=Methyloceanibacter sp. TaxID=1965321 RepID=UPI003D9B3C39
MTESSNVSAMAYCFVARPRRAASFALALAALGSACGCLAAMAATGSSWVDGTHSKARLVSGMVAEDGKDTVLAGVQISMDPGWKTYWRNPGDSGVPPSFDWSGSKNLKDAEVLYPVPHRFKDANGTAVGYGDDVVFPVRITPERAGDPVELKLAVQYGLCKNLCIPNEATLELELPAAAAASAGGTLIAEFVAQVPKPAEKGALPAVKNVEAKLDGERPELFIDIQFPPFAKGADLFIDGGEAFVPVPTPVGKPESGTQRFAVIFASQAEAARIKGKLLSLTLVTQGGSREASLTVD